MRHGATTVFRGVMHFRGSYSCKRYTLQPLITVTMTVLKTVAETVG
jgi:hypothetical protein